MSIDYRDYGYIEGNSEVTLERVEAQTSQVYKATHDGAGNRLSYRHRSFISFSYGGKVIEDFGFIAITDGDRLERDIYSNFSDVVENHETLDGQIYWGTHFSNGKLDLTLTTDGITAKQLDEFKQWFVPGKGKELILMEHPNRAIIARVAEVPRFSMLPFSTQSKVMVTGVDYTVEVTLFKGNISLSFVMDEPYWYAKNNLILPLMTKNGANDVINLNDDPYKIEKILNGYKKLGKRIYIEYVKNNTTITSLYEFIEMDIYYTGRWWKIKCKNEASSAPVYFCYPNRNGEGDDLAPRITSIFTGSYTLTTDAEDSALSPVDRDAAKDLAKIVLEDNIPHLKMISTPVLLAQNTIAEGDAESKVFNTDTNNTINGLAPNTGARVSYYGYVALDTVTWQEEMELYNGNPLYLYYSGTAPSKPTLQFTFTPTFNGDGYISLPRNQYSHPEEIEKKNYNYISFNDHKFCFTTPSLITGYNQAINIVKNYTVGQSVSELITLLKENINEYYARAWAVYCVKLVAGDETTIKSTFLDMFITRMKYLISNGTTPYPITCFFDSKNGTATVTYSSIRKANGVDDYNSENLLVSNEEQNAGDMVKSDYLIIEGRCYPSFNGYISKEECHVIKTDFSSSNKLKPITLNFQNMYY